MRVSTLWLCGAVFVLLASHAGCSDVDSSDPPGHLRPLGSHRPAEGDIDVLDEVPHPIEFYERYVKPGKPVLFRGATRKSRAFQRWNDKYLAETFGSLVMMTEHGKKENRSEGTSYVQLKTFLSRYNDSDEYMVETLPPKMHDDFELLSCLLCGGYTKNLRDAVMWFSSGGTKSVLHNDDVDNINCLMSGTKDIFLIDKKYKSMAHIDVHPGSYSSVDVDSVDVYKYPGLGKVPWWGAHMEAGDCFFIPFRWYHQLRSYGRNLAINIWWVPVRKFDESDCYAEKDGEKVRKPLASYASLSLYGFAPGEHNRHLLMEELQSNPRAASKGISKKMLTDLAEESIAGEEENGHEAPKDWKKAIDKIFELCDHDKNNYLSSIEILEIPSTLLVAAMGKGSEGPPQDQVQVDDNYAREHGLEPDELDERVEPGKGPESDGPEEAFGGEEGDEFEDVPEGDSPETFDDDLDEDDGAKHTEL